MSIAEVISHIPVALVDDVTELLRMIISAPDSGAAVERAKTAIASDAADAVADEALREALSRK